MLAIPFLGKKFTITSNLVIFQGVLQVMFPNAGLDYAITRAGNGHKTFFIQFNTLITNATWNHSAHC